MDKKSSKSDVVLTNIEVIDNVNSWITREGKKEDYYDIDDTAQSHSIEGISISDRYYDLQVDFKVKKEIPYYLVYAIYGTGNSFGKDDGQIQFIDLFELKEVAEACKAAALKDDNEMMFQYTNESLMKITCSKSWWGYFEHLDYIEIQEVYLIET